MASLAEVHVGRPGLPRGRHRLPIDEVRRRQRERLVAAALSTVADAGYAATTVAEIARRARVSLKAFYEHFEDKRQCVLMAVAESMLLMRPETVATAEMGAEEQLRAIMGRPLEFFAAQPELARAYHLELRAAGAGGRIIYFTALAHFATVLEHWHRRHEPEAAAQTPAEAYVVAAGGIEQLVTRWVDAGRTAELPELTELATSLVMRTLGASR